MQDFQPVTSVITSLQSLSSLQLCRLYASDIASFNNMLLSLPLSLQGLLLSNCPLRKNTQFVRMLHRFPQLLALEISDGLNEDIEESQLVSVDDILSLALHPPVLLQWFHLEAAMVDVMKNKEDIDNAENGRVCTCIAKLTAAAFPLRYCPVAGFYWITGISLDE